jgi:hypothetical protein
METKCYLHLCHTWHKINAQLIVKKPSVYFIAIEGEIDERKSKK